MGIYPASKASVEGEAPSGFAGGGGDASPYKKIMDLTTKHCVPCKGGIPPLSDTDEDRYIVEVPAWSLLREGIHKIKREFIFKGFRGAIGFVNKVAEIAEAEGHHPDIYIFYNKVQLELFTHAAQGLLENDFIVAAKIDRISI